MAEATIAVVAGKAAESLFDVAKKEISYMWKCRENVEKLKNEAEKLKVMRGRIQQKIDIANRKGDNLSVGVQEWVDKANVEISTAEEFLEREAIAKKTCFKLGLCGNWSSLYRYGKGATNKALSLVQHQEHGTTYESCVSVETHAPGPLDVYQNKNIDGIETHKLVLEKVMTTIEDENIQIIGIYGLGGVGKTTLAKEVASKMKNKFVSVAFTTISQTINIEKVKKDIEEATKQIMQGKKILIILDDVWEKLDLEQLCIPCGTNYMNCKILLTSRNEDVCRKMNAQSTICVDPLSLKEAWILFKQVVGERVETDVNLKPIAMKVAEECGGLPLLVQVVGNALKDKNINSWNSALTRLKKHAPLDIDPDIRKAFTHLKLSYDYLESEEVKGCFLLCSMFPEDKNILLESLVNYGVGLAKFNNLESINDARYRVQNAVNILTSSGLLLSTDNKTCTKMHDVVRDVALLIASEGDNKFFVEAGKDLSEWLPRNKTIESYSGISLMYNSISKIPENELHFPHLSIFLINVNELSWISNEFIGGMKEARVLDLAWNKISSLPQSLKLLTKLRTLDLRGNKSIREISILGELKDLEILILHKTGIIEIPHEIGQLVNLRLLDVSYCEIMCHIYPGVLSKLHWLEELCIGFYSIVMHYDRIYDSLLEVMNLSKLTHLDLFVPSSDVIPEGFNWRKLNTYVIQIGGEKKGMSFLGNPNSILEHHLVLSTENLKIPLAKSIKNLFEVCSSTVLESIENLDNILPTLYHDGFNELESILLEDCQNVTCLVDTRNWDEFQAFDSYKHDLGDEGKTNEIFFTKLKHLHLSELERLEALWNCPDGYISLSNLVTLCISSCHGLVTVFSVSVAQGLVNLHELRVEFCEGLEEIIWGSYRASGTEMAADIIVFPSLERIFLYSLERLISFWNGNSTIKYPSLVEVSVRYCRGMEKWGDGIQDTPKLKFVNKVPLDGPYDINHAVVNSSEIFMEYDGYNLFMNGIEMGTDSFAENEP